MISSRFFSVRFRFLLYIYNKTSGLKFKISKAYLTAGNLYLQAHIFYFNPTLKARQICQLNI